jgi:hypothetical protein
MVSSVASYRWTANADTADLVPGVFATTDLEIHGSGRLRESPVRNQP